MGRERRERARVCTRKSTAERARDTRRGARGGDGNFSLPTSKPAANLIAVLKRSNSGSKSNDYKNKGHNSHSVLFGQRRFKIIIGFIVEHDSISITFFEFLLQISETDRRPFGDLLALENHEHTVYFSLVVLVIDRSNGIIFKSPKDGLKNNINEFERLLFTHPGKKRAESVLFKLRYAWAWHEHSPEDTE
jgi:hypothetical protein